MATRFPSFRSRHETRRTAEWNTSATRFAFDFRLIESVMEMIFMRRRPVPRETRTRCRKSVECEGAESIVDFFCFAARPRRNKRGIESAGRACLPDPWRLRPFETQSRLEVHVLCTKKRFATMNGDGSTRAVEKKTWNEPGPGDSANARRPIRPASRHQANSGRFPTGKERGKALHK